MVRLRFSWFVLWLLPLTLLAGLVVQSFLGSRGVTESGTTFCIQIERSGGRVSLSYEDCIELVKEDFLSEDLVQLTFKLRK